ncbi:MAG: LPS assembly lipoprotein LptE [Halomonas sp.]|nr:LPS assembly lipoprotein LptE [Halomonas sp.]
MKRRIFLARSVALLGLGAVATGLAGCGFHLRGTERQALAIDALDLAGPPTLLTDRARRALENAGVEVTDRAPLVLNLGTERVEDVSLRGGDLVNDEVELRLVVPFSVQRRRDNAYLIDQGSLEATTTYIVNGDDPLVRHELQETALDELRQSVIRQLIDQLRRQVP